VLVQIAIGLCWERFENEFDTEQATTRCRFDLREPYRSVTGEEKHGPYYS